MDKKPVVPQFVADWYEENKDYFDWNLYNLRTHCPVCKEKIGVFDEYFNTYGFCSEYCGYEYYGISRL